MFFASLPPDYYYYVFLRWMCCRVQSCLDTITLPVYFVRNAVGSEGKLLTMCFVDSRVPKLIEISLVDLGYGDTLY